MNKFSDLQITTKRVQINKAQATMVATIATAVFVAVFSLVSSKALLSQRSYQARVIGKKQIAKEQLQSNVNAISQLVASYNAFVGTPENVLGGNPSGTGPLDGDNAKIVLDALPSKYDFPALATSLDKILTDKNFTIGGITGTDDEVAQSAVNASGDPQPVPMPFEIDVSGSYSSIQDLITQFQKSIRPFSIQQLSFTGSNSSMQFKMVAQTYYQPEKDFSIKNEAVK